MRLAGGGGHDSWSCVYLALADVLYRFGGLRVGAAISNANGYSEVSPDVSEAALSVAITVAIQTMALILITPPAVEPVSLPELKEYLRMDPGDDSQDVTIQGLAMAARSWAEVFTGRRFVKQTWRLLMDFFPGYIDLKLAGQRTSSPFVSGSNAVLVGIRYAIVLSFPPVRSIVSFVYQDANGNVTVMDPSSGYVADIESNPARLTPPFGQMWPVARVVVNAVQIDYELGYAQPLTVSSGIASPPDPNLITASGYTFGAGDVGRPISIAGAGPNGDILNTIVSAISSPPDANASLRDAPTGDIQNAAALIVNAANGNPAHWEMIKAGIKMLVAEWFKRQGGSEGTIPPSVKMVLWPVRDLRF